jgi:hypothetical protein
LRNEDDISIARGGIWSGFMSCDFPNSHSQTSAYDEGVVARLARQSEGAGRRLPAQRGMAQRALD